MQFKCPTARLPFLSQLLNNTPTTGSPPPHFSITLCFYWEVISVLWMHSESRFAYVITAWHSASVGQHLAQWQQNQPWPKSIHSGECPCQWMTTLHEWSLAICRCKILLEDRTLTWAGRGSLHVPWSVGGKQVDKEESEKTARHWGKKRSMLKYPLVHPCEAPLCGRTRLAKRGEPWCF